MRLPTHYIVSSAHPDELDIDALDASALKARLIAAQSELASYRLTVSQLEQALEAARAANEDAFDDGLTPSEAACIRSRSTRHSGREAGGRQIALEPRLSLVPLVFPAVSPFSVTPSAASAAQ